MRTDLQVLVQVTQAGSSAGSVRLVGDAENSHIDPVVALLSRPVAEQQQRPMIGEGRGIMVLNGTKKIELQGRSSRTSERCSSVAP